MRLIGINGFKGAGKDSTFKAIRNIYALYGYGAVERRAFADNLKVMAMASLGYDGTDAVLLDDAEVFKAQGLVTSTLEMGIGSDLTGRQYIINYGQHARRVFGEDFWVDQILPRHEPSFEAVWRVSGRNRHNGLPPAIGCVTDVRMVNEALRIRELGGEVWKVVRSGVHSDGQSTEQPLPNELVDQTIFNNGTPSELAVSVALCLGA